MSYTKAEINKPPFSLIAKWGFFPKTKPTRRPADFYILCFRWDVTILTVICPVSGKIEIELPTYMS